ncbi:MAG: glycoside hydrolase family 92 protein, partial [Phaeodactylibacter sp.]|nr:glycoside hydrolase family 92 protein [Phaeodactylibacter sp.]
LEYYLSDWTLAQLALALGKSEDAKLLSERAKGYLNYLDPETGMLRPKYANGKFYENFDPEQGKNFEPVTGFVEGTAWQYRFYVPHDIPFLIDTLGGGEAFVNALSTCFSDDQYDVANEPDITYPFLYNYVPGSEWRTQEQVLKIIREHYTNTPGGIPGNDDTGTLSTWLAFSMMGLYPVCPADMDYAIFTPSFEEVRLQLHPDYYPGKALVIKASKKDEPSTYIQSARFNNKKVKRLFLSHQSLTEGGTLELDLTSKPKKK